MAIGRESLNKNLRLKLDDNPKIQGLAKFITDLERAYFSKVTVRNCTPFINDNNLVIELDCPLSLIELVHQIKCGGCCSSGLEDNTGHQISYLEKAHDELCLKNDSDIEIEEFSLFLTDCSIIIKKIYKGSIVEQLVNIFEAFSEHLESLTNRLTEIPFEIYVPVFEEDLIENDIKIANVEQSNNERKDYFGYWGLYFEEDIEAVIYELPKRRIISGDLVMLNH